jgi:diaminopimelate decarboxylase
MQLNGQLATDVNGQLTIEGCNSLDLAREFGTPLFVVSETQVRDNYRSLHRAFSSRYPDVLLAYGIKANNHPAIVTILRQEGAGADCFGPGELEVAQRAGVAPEATILNGSDKGELELTLAIERGVNVNVDNLEELDRLIEIADGLGRRARTMLRLKLRLEALEDVYLDDYRYNPPRISLAKWAQGHKFGMTFAEACEAGRRALGNGSIDLVGLHYHLKGQTSDAAYFGTMTTEFLASVAELRQILNWTPSQIDLGGGFSYGREDGYGPGGRDRHVPSADAYAESIVGALCDGLARHELPRPKLMLEPGRVLVANAGVLLTRVGTVKRAEGQDRWVHVDASTNHLPRIRTGNWHYHVVAASKLGQAATEPVDLVGGTCDAADIVAQQRALPRLERGDLLAILDVGAYAESTACQFNTYARPATVLVRGSDAELIARRETTDDVLGRFALAGWLTD